MARVVLSDYDGYNIYWVGIFTMSFLQAEDWYKCPEHDCVYPRGAYCPACGEPEPEPTLTDLKKQLDRIETLLSKETE